MSRLVRSQDKVIAGVCAGVAEHFGWNVRNVRLVWLIAAICGVGAPVLFYLILMFLMPDSVSAKMNFEERMQKRLGNRR
ncbi:MAG: PspC domain-containing protein [Bacteroidaceae bacterium]|nr:PspC domain-containing protein [Bacteroidaceae bacterium]MBR3906709.1 PspC domain-containing protein [Bacteroidaceae bacterium]